MKWFGKRITYLMQGWDEIVLFREYWLFVPLCHEMTSAFSWKNSKYLQYQNFLTRTSHPNSSRIPPTPVDRWGYFSVPQTQQFQSQQPRALVVINSRATWPHPYFTCKSPYTVNLMKFLGPKPAFELTNNFPRSKHLDRVYGSVFVSGKFWNKSDVPIFEDCKRDSNDDVFSGYNFPVLILQKNSSTSI